MDCDKYIQARKYFEMTSSRLMAHENKPDARVGFPITCYRECKISNKEYYTVGTNTFNCVMEEDLIVGINNHPKKFGTGIALDVISAIQRHHNAYELEEFAQYLGHEHFCYAMEFINGVLNPRVLRIDLFRKISPDPQTGKQDFVGGIFHAMRHFSLNGINLSTGNDKNDVAYPHRVIEFAIRAFFEQVLIQKDKKNFYSEVKIDERYNLRFHFFLEEKTGVYFINTAYKVKRKA